MVVNSSLLQFIFANERTGGLSYFLAVFLSFFHTLSSRVWQPPKHRSMQHPAHVEQDRVELCLCSLADLKLTGKQIPA